MTTKRTRIIEKKEPIDFRCTTCLVIKPLSECYPRRKICLTCRQDYERELYYKTRAHKNPHGTTRGRPRIHPLKEQLPDEPKRSRGRPKKVFVSNLPVKSDYDNLPIPETIIIN